MDDKDKDDKDKDKGAADAGSGTTGSTRSTIGGAVAGAIAGTALGTVGLLRHNTTKITATAANTRPVERSDGGLISLAA